MSQIPGKYFHGCDQGAGFKINWAVVTRSWGQHVGQEELRRHGSYDDYGDIDDYGDYQPHPEEDGPQHVQWKLQNVGGSPYKPTSKGIKLKHLIDTTKLSGH